MLLRGATLNASGTITGGISGTGTATNIMKWASTTSATNSIMVDNSTDIVVGGGMFANMFYGLFDWVIDVSSGSTSYLTFNGTTLSFDESKLNATIDDRVPGSQTNIFDQDLNTTSNVNFENLSVQGNFSAGGNTLFVGNSSVGINTSSPDADFHISDGNDAFIVSLSNNGQASVIASELNAAGITVVGGTTSFDSPLGLFVDYNTRGATGTRDFRIQHNGNAVFTIDGGTNVGDVGIGTSNPGVILDVEDNDPTIRLTDNSINKFGEIEFSAGASLARIKLLPNQGAFPGMFVQVEALIGATLDLLFLVDADQVVDSHMFVELFEGGNLYLQTRNPVGDGFIFFRTNTTTTGVGNERVIIDNMGMGIGNVTDLRPTTTLEVFGNFTANKTLFVGNDGKVGIGTISPLAVLDVTGSGNPLFVLNTTTTGGD